MISEVWSHVSLPGRRRKGRRKKGGREDIGAGSLVSLISTYSYRSWYQWRVMDSSNHLTSEFVPGSWRNETERNNTQVVIIGCFECQLTSTFSHHFPIIPVIYPQISMTEINQGIFCTLFQTCKNFKIQLFPVISTVIPVIELHFSPVYFLLFLQLAPN